MGEPEPEKKPSTFREFVNGCHDTFWRWYGFDTLADDFKTHGGAVRKGAALRFLCGVVIVTSLLCVFCRGCYDDSAIRSSDDNARSNDDLAKSYKSQLDAANTTVVNLKVDAAETKREKDSEISDLKTENASLNNQVATFQATRIMEISTNFDGSFSKILSSATYPEAILNLEINGQTNIAATEDFGLNNVFPIKNLIPLRNSREISFNVCNYSKPTAVNVAVDFISHTISQTNIFADQWTFEPPSGDSHWHYKIEDSIQQLGSNTPQTIRILPNFKDTYFDAEIILHADNSPSEFYIVRFFIPQ
jgi:hypothetical protein